MRGNPNFGRTTLSGKLYIKYKKNTTDTFKNDFSIVTNLLNFRYISVINFQAFPLAKKPPSPTLSLSKIYFMQDVLTGFWMNKWLLNYKFTSNFFFIVNIPKKMIHCFQLYFFDRLLNPKWSWLLNVTLIFSVWKNAF